MLVMTTDHKIGPGTFWDGIEVSVDRRLKRDRVPFGVEQREVQWQVQARLAVTVEMADPISLALHLPAKKPSIILVQNLSDVFDAVHGFRPVVREHGHVGLRRRRFVVRFGVGWIVAQQIVLDQHRAGVDPKAVNTAVQPKTHGARDSFANLTVSPIQIRLTWQKRMIVKLPPLLAPLPGAAPETAEPIVWRAAI